MDLHIRYDQADSYKLDQADATAEIHPAPGRVLESGAIVQIRVWRLPEATEERPYGLKYSSFYGRPGERAVGYDNEAGKGDHRHYREREEPYQFTTYQNRSLRGTRQLPRWPAPVSRHLAEKERSADP